MGTPISVSTKPTSAIIYYLPTISVTNALTSRLLIITVQSHEKEKRISQLNTNSSSNDIRLYISNTTTQD